MKKPTANTNTSDPVVSFRNKPHLREMIARIEDKTGMSQSDIIRSCLVIQLPKMMKQYNAGS